ncbi:cytochrome b/b6 domain-containing protein [Oceanobacter sp. 4_MG-2023]|uniref:cytochrome b/b6 domain-containing protein n=1 Tax=Oceanobacter sp. 4_MG-2023 TaxID=3062623 RepID=UPI0027358CCE|nr:cytochrome b/b6 domain-containing protein [Oceanobacter sp. 4_MG-2023]MDP2547305.1 cytochrome b/b6 domain-containing protein [Oceanobacter sp. 4_MG-2023]
MKVWDSFVRGYHWLQVMLLVGCWWTAEEGEMGWHMSLASCLVALWITRLGWGLFGSSNARFSQFVPGPQAVIRFSRTMLTGKEMPRHAGHNPLGALMVVALMLLIAAQWGSGLFATDEIFTEGPLVEMVSADTATLLTQWHHLNFDLIVVLVVLHVAAVVFHQWRGEPLVQAMITGKRNDLSAAEAPTLVPAWRAWVVFLLLWVVSNRLIVGSWWIW